METALAGTAAAANDAAAPDNVLIA
jgi:hypothetical protein